MDLWYRDLEGQGEPVVILHGLFGSSQNWAGMGRKLSSAGHVFAPDLRNHGESPHAPTHSLADCVQDLADWAAARGLERLRLIGHSMGGLIAMGFALRYPQRTLGVASIDIAPRPYPPEHAGELAALKADIRHCRSRAEVEAVLLPLVHDVRTRQFLMTNAVRERDGFRWRPNVPVLERSTVASDWAEADGRYEGEALLIACGKSSYVQPEDHAVMRRFFPRVRIETLVAADHWPHVTAPQELEAALRGFLGRAAISGADPRL
jgi:esterase